MSIEETVNNYHIIIISDRPESKPALAIIAPYGNPKKSRRYTEIGLQHVLRMQRRKLAALERALELLRGKDGERQDEG